MAWWSSRGRLVVRVVVVAVVVRVPVVVVVGVVVVVPWRWSWSWRGRGGGRWWWEWPVARAPSGGAAASARPWPAGRRWRPSARGAAGRGRVACVSQSTVPSTSTPVVWVAATVAPMPTTWRPVPRRPTTAAAISVLPWPGARLWRPPSSDGDGQGERPKPTVEVRARRRCPTRRQGDRSLSPARLRQRGRSRRGRRAAARPPGRDVDLRGELAQRRRPSVG